MHVHGDENQGIHRATVTWPWFTQLAVTQSVLCEELWNFAIVFSNLQFCRDLIFSIVFSPWICSGYCMELRFEMIGGCLTRIDISET